MGRVSSLGLLACLVLLAADPALGQYYGVAARVNGVPISNQTLENSYQEYLREKNVNIGAIRYPNRIKAMRREVLDLLIDQELAWQAAQAQGVVADEQQVAESVALMSEPYESEAAFHRELEQAGFTAQSYREHIRRLVSADRYLEEAVGQVTVSDEEIARFYEDNAERFLIPSTVRARHILLKLAPGADQATGDAVLERMQGIATELERGEHFALLATRYSEDKTAAAGGDLGYFTRGQMVAPFEEVAFTLEPGQVSGIVRTRFGLHLIRVEDRQPARPVPLENARGRIEAHLIEVKRDTLRKERLKALRDAADIEILTPL